MATEAGSADAAVNGVGSGGDIKLAADALMRKHEAEAAAHHVTVEDAVDEEDLKRPATSAHAAAAEPMSAKAAGKQRASDQRPASLDTQSHDLFPSLGAGPQARAPRPVAPAWGTKKPSIVSGSGGPGLSPATANGHPPNGSTTPSSRASTPSSTGPPTPASTAASSNRTGPPQPQRGPMPQPMSIPGKYSERISLFPQEMKPRSELKKPVSNILQDINRRSKANVTMLSGGSGAVHFDAKGPVEAVRQALKEVAKEVGSKQSTKVNVPASVRPHIIGRQGAVIQGISQRTGARIQVPRPEDGATPPGEEEQHDDDDDDDDIAIEVVIEGDSVAAAMARREIENIVNERTSSVNLRLKDIPAEFYPFIAGPHNARVTALEDGRDVRVIVPHRHIWTSPPPPAPAADEPPAFVAATDDLIRLAGDRVAVQEVRAEIERQVEELRRQITLSQLDINRGQHQFVVGDRGTSLHDFLAETGCTVLLPPDADDTETLTIIGPPEKIDGGVNKVMDLATSMQMTNVDISRQHPNAPHGPTAHARHVTRYLQQRGEIKRLERAYDAHIALPTLDDGPVTWEIYSRDPKNNIRARTEIVNLVNGHPPARLAPFDIDPFYHHHVQDRSAPKLRDDLGVRLIFPEARDENTEVLMIYEGTPAAGREAELPKKPASAAERRESEAALTEARQHLIALLAKQEEVITKDIEVPVKYHDKVQRFANRERQNTKAGEIPVRVQTGHRGGRAALSARSQNTTSTPAPSDDHVSLRGPAESVEAMAQKIVRFVEEEKVNEKERDHLTTFEYPQKFANFLIGKRGENIRKYREEFDVEIQVSDGRVEIKGPKAKAEAAKTRIVALGKKLEDEATYVLKIKPQYHRDLIGAKGSQVNRLQERYDVRVNFPRSAPVVSDDRSAAGDTASEVGGGHKSNRPPQAADEVTIRGPKKGADAAKEELLSLLQWTIDHSHSATISVARSQIPSLIGQGGREMESMRLATGAHIDVPDNKHDASDASARAEIRVRGTKKQVEDAKKLLEQRAKVFDESVTRTIEVDKKHHKALIGPSGTTIRDIVVKAGGPDDRRELARMVRFPRQESEESSIRVEGSQPVVDKIVAAIEAISQQRENQVVETIDVAHEKHRLLIGRGGETRRRLESQFNVTVDVPKQHANGEARSGVKVTGLPADVEKARAHIAGMIKGHEGETVQVPRRVHHHISDNGQFFRRLRNDHKVTVDHDGQQPPAKPTGSGPRAARATDGASLPLITDEADSAEAFSWTVVDDKDEHLAEEASIPWILRGPPENVVKARTMLEAALERAQQQSSTGYLILPDPRTYRLVIGPGGSQVNAIRKQTGCKIDVPRDQAKGEAIAISGSTEGVEEAKEMILEVVKSGGIGGRRGGPRD